MKKKFLAVFGIIGALALASCDNTGNNSNNTSNSNYSSAEANNTSVEIAEDTITEQFSLTDESGNIISGNNGVYTITSAGTYTAKGKLESGQIYVDASNEDVEIDLKGVSIASQALSPIYVNDCANFTLKAVNESLNYIYDNRITDYSGSTDDTNGTGAVFVKNGDLKVKGKGTLSIQSAANSGIHGKDNVSVKNVTMLIQAVNNGIKGNDKVTIEENPTLGIVAGNNGIVTSNSDMGTNAQHGYIYINGGTITINSYGDGIDAAYSVYVGTSTDSDGVTYSPSIDIYTNKYSSYINTSESSSSTSSTTTTTTTYAQFGPGGNPGMMPGGGFNGGGMAGGQAAEKADSSAKAIKANESIDITAGNIFTYTYDDSLHTNCDEKLENGNTPKAAINISGGTLNLKASDDAIHADGTLTVNGGTINVIESHEGLEGKAIVINDGNITVTASDDGVNASNSITITGGRLDVNMSNNGDVDGIDSNATISITGGIIITRGPNSEMAAPIDADRTITMTGGILIVVGYCPTLSTKLTKTASTSGNTTGTHTVTVESETISYTNNYSYNGQTTVYASSSATIK